MDNLPQQQYTIQGEDNHNPPPTPILENKSSRVKWLIIGILSALILIGTTIFIWFSSQRNTIQDRSQTNQVKDEQPVEHGFEKYSMLYLHTERTKDQKEVVRLLKTDAATQNKSEIATMIGSQNFSTNPYIISKNGKYIGKYSLNIIFTDSF